MAKGYRPVDRDQAFLFPPDMREWLPAGHPVWLVIRAVVLMDTSAFHAGRKTGGAGTAGYDPDMLVTVLVWAYAHGVVSSREIERLCGTDVAFRVICAGNRPDHVTFARFRKDFPGLVEEFFGQVLILCARLGMGKLGTIALDGMKIAADASKAANRTGEGLRKLAAEAVAAHAEADAAEDELFGAGVRGDEVPEEAWSPRSRDGRIRAALADLEAGREAAAAEEAAKAEGFRARQRAGERTGCSPVSAAVALAQEKLARVTAAQQAKIDQWEARNAASVAETGRPLRNPPRRPAGGHCRVKEAAAQVEAAREREQAAQARAAEREANRKGPGPVRNVTDPDSRLLPVRGGGFIQGYNCQDAAADDRLMLGGYACQDTGDALQAQELARVAEKGAAVVAAAHAAHAADPALLRACHGRLCTLPARDKNSPDHDAAACHHAMTSQIDVLVEDAGYHSEANLTAPGPDRLIADAKTRDLARREPAQGPPPAGATPLQANAHRLATPEGRAAYKRRAPDVEGLHASLKDNGGLRRFSLRGLPN